jgi:hypothetical protein
MKSVNIYDYLVILGYFLFMLGIGLYFMKINKGAKEYFAGGSMIPWWVSGMTLYMANFSAWTFTGAAGFAYATGWFAICYFGTWSISYYLGSQLTASRWRRTRSISPVEYTYTRFNFTTQQFLSAVISVNFTLSAGVQLAATTKLLAPVMGLDITMVTLVTGIVILLYTFMGGLWAVSITDVVQGVILLSITFIVMPLAGRWTGKTPGIVAPPLVRPLVQRSTLHRTLAGFHLHDHVSWDRGRCGTEVLQREGREGREACGKTRRRAVPHRSVRLWGTPACGQTDLARPVTGGVLQTLHRQEPAGPGLHRSLPEAASKRADRRLSCGHARRDDEHAELGLQYGLLDPLT